MPDKNCLICGKQDLAAVEDFNKLTRITSDCKPFTVGGSLYVCLSCAAVQKYPDDKFLTEIEEIYSTYSAYDVANGAEQMVFNSDSQMLENRSDVIISKLISKSLVPIDARALDVGCGHGVTLQAISSRLPGWKLNGYELNSNNEEKLKAIKNFDKLYAGDLKLIPEKFNFISMIHSLEHFLDPASTIIDLKDRLEKKGSIFIEVCNLDLNPFDILVADHVMHFSPQSLGQLLQRCGFHDIKIDTSIINKELSALGKVEIKSNDEELKISGQDALNKMNANVRNLIKLTSFSSDVALNAEQFGIFGTSIAGSWLGAIMADRVDFFVDEDPSRIGKIYMGKPIISPDKIPKKAKVFLALSPGISQNILKRWAKFEKNFVLPIFA